MPTADAGTAKSDEPARVTADPTSIAARPAIVAHPRAASASSSPRTSGPTATPSARPSRMALALRALGKQADGRDRRDAAALPAAVPRRRRHPDHAARSTETLDAALIMECSALDRTGVARARSIAGAQHRSSSRQHALRRDQLDRRIRRRVRRAGVHADRGARRAADAGHRHALYLAMLTDTGSFHFSHLTPRTFEIARRCVEAGADPQWIARTHYDSNTLAACASSARC